MNNPLFDSLFAPHITSKKTFACVPGGRDLSYEDLIDGVFRAAGVLVGCGLRKGDRLAVQVDKSLEALQIYGACLMTGVVFLPLNTAYTPDEVAYFIEDATPVLFICNPARETQLQTIAARYDVQLMTLSADGQGSFATHLQNADPITVPAPCALSDIAALLYTSGTTGRAKGAMLTHENLLSNAQVLVEQWRISDQDRLLHALPIFHAHGLFVAVNTSLLTGGSLIYLTSFQLDRVIEVLPLASTMMGVPTFYTRLLEDDRFTEDIVRNMRLFTSGSAPLLAATHEQFSKRTGHRILERYGMTETGMNTSNPYDKERRAGTVGFPLPGVELRILKAGSDIDAPRGDIGMIEVRGPNVFTGYWRNPDKTREELRENGFFVTGDLGFQDEDGYVHIVGRDKDLIITGGYNVYPKEVERAIDEIPGVRETAVVGVPHPDFGEGVIAVIVLEQNARLDVPALKKTIGKKLAKFKHPKEFLCVDELPRNAMGKVQKNILRSNYATLFSNATVRAG